MTVVAERGEVMRVVLQPSMKERYQQKCTRCGQNMSERTRQLIAQDLATDADVSPSQRLDTILASASGKLQASAMPVPSIEEIDAFIDQVRAERIASGLF